ncbi:AAA family ATPase [Staphylococcus hominis]|uniref:AAA family ATPase n=1 Tax=Staphylococcus hominis TaxID=1290 RepID=UPI00066C1402|nr:AAA family ATPase [Staphylococcus hominis]UXR84728.1 ATP-binding protein [Staphylococcus hominis]
MDRIKIYNLFGHYDVELNLNNEYNMKIYVGENGVGKTTILNIIFSVITGEVQKIINIEFSKIKIEIGKKKYVFSKDEMLISSSNLKENFLKLRHLLRMRLEINQYKEMLDFLHQEDIVTIYNKLKGFKEEGIITTRLYHRIVSTLFDTIDIDEVSNIEDTNEWFKYLSDQKNLSQKMMYFPTFRRIEEELLDLDDDLEISKNVKHGVREYNTNNPSIKMLKTGMKDVEKIIQKIEQRVEKNSIDSFNKVTGDMMTFLLDENSNDLESNALEMIEKNQDKIKVILSRISDENLSEEIKEKVIKKVQNENSIENEALKYFVSKLLEYYNKQENLEKQIKEYVKVCNKYLVNKNMFYDEAKMKISILNKIDNNKIELNTLSSGEKQIISIFTLVYLENLDEKLFVMIDEPELSLSVIWQASLIEDLYNSGNIDYLIAVTHSPFIYETLPEEVSENIMINYKQVEE